jgi:hypothetical protein
MRLYHASMVLILTAGALAGCSGFGKPQQAATPDPNLFPTNYRTALLAFLRQSLTNRSDFRGVMISEPAIKTVGGSQHYVVCVQFSPQSAIKTKAAVYLSGQMTQFVDAGLSAIQGARGRQSYSRGKQTRPVIGASSMKAAGA